MICPEARGPVKRLPVLRLAEYQFAPGVPALRRGAAAAAAAAGGATITGIENTRDTMPSVAFGLDGGGDHEHAASCRHQHQLMLERLLRPATSLVGGKIVAGHQGETVLGLEAARAASVNSSCGTMAMSTGSAWFDRGWLPQREMHADEAGGLAGRHRRNHVRGQASASLGPAALSAGVAAAVSAPARNRRRPASSSAADNRRNERGQRVRGSRSSKHPPLPILTGDIRLCAAYLARMGGSSMAASCSNRSAMCRSQKRASANQGKARGNAGSSQRCAIHAA